VSGSFLRFLEALGLSAERPNPRFFEELFLRFSLRFPFESLTRRERGRTPEAVFDDFVEAGTGSVGFERARAFLALGRALGYDIRALRGERIGRASTGDSAGPRLPHAGLLVDLDGREFLLDPALPIPILLPLEPAGTELPSPAGGISLARADGGLRLAVNARGRARERARFELARAPENLLEELGRAEEEAGPPHEALRFHDDRLLRYRDGKIEVLDRWSRLEYTVATGLPEILDQLFLISIETLLPDAPLEPLDPRAASGTGTLWAYDSSDLPVEVLKARLASPESLIRLNPAGTCFDELRTREDGWSWRLTDEADVTLRKERIRRTRDGVSIETLAGESPIARRSFQLEPEGAGTRVTLRAVLSRPVPPRGLTESVRKTLVFHLASELLALSRDVEADVTGAV
jgi:N-acetyltransferase